MSKFADKIVHELKTLLPLTFYFLFMNELLALTQLVVLSEYGLSATSFLRALIMALLIAKVVLIMDLMPLMNIFREKKIIYSVLWKASFYSLASVFLQFAEGIIRPLISTGDLGGAYNAFIAETVWSRFILVQGWMFILLFNYVLIREISTALGPGVISKLVFRGRT